MNDFVRLERPLTRLLCAVYLLLAAGFSLGPLFEAPDEIEHYRYVRTVAATGRIPTAWDGENQRTQFHQSPLYYLPVVPLVALLGDDGFAALDGRFNPFYPQNMDVPDSDNKNLYLHTRDEASTGVGRAVHLVRLYSVLLGFATVVTGARIFRLLFPDSPARRLLALALMATFPQFVFMSGMVNNDNLITLLAALALEMTLRCARAGWTWRRAALLGVVLAAALLTKTSALYLAFPVGVAVLWRLRQSWKYAALTLAIVAAGAGWWYARNYQLYGDFGAMEAMWIGWKAERIGGLDLPLGIQRMSFAYASLWARFGHTVVPVSPLMYRLFDALVLAGALGLGVMLLRAIFRRLWKQPGALLWAVVTVFFAAWVAALVSISSLAWSGNQGRYLLPALVSMAALWSAGLTALLPRRAQGVGAGALGVGLCGIAALCLFGYYYPTYAVRPAPDVIHYPLSYHYRYAELIGISTPQVRGRPGDTVQVTLYWRALRPGEPSLIVALDGGAFRRDSYPATGNRLASDWRAGETWAETFTVTIPPDATPQRVYPLTVTLYQLATQTPLLVTDADGNAVTPVAARVIVSGTVSSDALTSASAGFAVRFGGSLRTTMPGVTRSGGTVSVCLRWVTDAPLSTDYHIFLHALDASGTIVTQWDGEPRGGAYPFSAWLPGEGVEDCITLEGVSDAVTTLALGVYDFASGARLPVTDAAGNAAGDALWLNPPEP